MSQSSDTLGERQSGRASVVVALALALAACGQAEQRTMPPRAANQPAPPPSAPWVWVVNRDTNDVVAYHAHTGEVAAQIAVEQSPNSVTSPRGTAKVYVTNEAANTISVIAKGTVTATLALATPESKPHHLSVSPDGKFVYVAEFGSNRVAVLNTQTDAVVGEFVAHPESPELTARQVRTHAVAVSPDGATLYAVNSGPGTVTALDAATGAIRWGPLAVGKNASEAVATTDGKKLYVSVRDEDLVRVVDLSNPAAPRVLDSAVAVGDQPDTLQLTPEGRTLVVALRASPAQVELVDTTSLAVRSVQIPGATTTGHQALSPNGAFTFVAVEGAESVAGLAVIDNREARVVGVHAYPGGGKPHGVFYGERLS